MDKLIVSGSAGLQSHEKVDDRVSVRCFSDLEVTIKSSAGIYFAGLIENISETGCLVSILNDRQLDLRCIVGLSITDYPVISGRVAWRHKSKAGIRFISPLAPNLVGDLVKRSLLTRLEQFQPSDDPTKELRPLARWEG